MSEKESDPQIVRHREASPFRDPADVKVFGEEIEAHLVRFFGPSDFIFHEIVSDKVHVDVLQFAPNDRRRFWTLVTSGMSDLPMFVPEDVPFRDELERAEMVISLPEDWVPRNADGTMNDKALRTPEKWWPLKWLTYLARFPHQYRTGLWIGHSIPNGDPPRALAAGTEMAGFILGPPITWP